MRPWREAQQLEDGIREVIASYRLTLARDRQIHLDQYEFEDVAREVVGVGSVGTLSWIVLLLGREHGDPLVLQLKQAAESVLEPSLEPSRRVRRRVRRSEPNRLRRVHSEGRAQRRLAPNLWFPGVDLGKCAVCYAAVARA